MIKRFLLFLVLFVGSFIAFGFLVSLLTTLIYPVIQSLGPTINLNLSYLVAYFIVIAFGLIKFRHNVSYLVAIITGPIILSALFWAGLYWFLLRLGPAGFM